MNGWEYFLWKTSSRLWVRPTLLGLGAVAWVGLAYAGERWLPRGWRVDIERETLVNLFGILASSMLTVATFSVSAMAAAFASVGSSATPRATRLVMSDTGVQSTLAAFLATFIYAVVAITALSAVRFGAAGRLILFAGFVATVGWVLVSFLHWVDRVSRLGRLGDTLQRLKEAGRRVFADRAFVSTLGGRPLAEAGGGGGREVAADRFGYLQNIDMACLQERAAEDGAEVLLLVRPGAFLSRGMPVAVLRGTEEGGELEKAVLKAMAVDAERDVRSDPRFAMTLLSEVSSKALSPAVNDTGTPMLVMDAQLELFDLWVRGKDETPELKYDRVFVPEITAEELAHDAFALTARDGAANLEVCLRLQRTLDALLRLGDGELSRAASHWREEGLELADALLPTESQRRTLREFVSERRGDSGKVRNHHENPVENRRQDRSRDST